MRTKKLTTGDKIPAFTINNAVWTMVDMRDEGDFRYICFNNRFAKLFTLNSTSKRLPSSVRSRDNKRWLIQLPQVCWVVYGRPKQETFADIVSMEVIEDEYDLFSYEEIVIKFPFFKKGGK